MAKKNKKQKQFQKTKADNNDGTKAQSGKRIAKSVGEVVDVFNEKVGAFSLYLAFGLIALVGYYVFKDYLLFDRLYIFKDIGSDTVNTKWPLFVHVARYIEQQGMPLWSFNQGMGQNIFDDGIKNPLNAILYFMNPETLGYRIGWVEFLKVLFGGTFFFLYLRTIKLTKFAAITGGLIYAFTGFMILGGGWYGYSSTALFVAFMLFAFERLFLDKNWYIFPLAIFFMADTNLYFYGLFLFLYSTFRFFAIKELKLREYIFLQLRMAGLGALGIAISLPFFMAILNRTLDSPRVGGSVSLADKLMQHSVFEMEGAHHYITVILRTFSSDIMGTAMQFKGWQNYLEAPIFYCGLLTLLLVPQAFVYGSKRLKIASGAFLGLWTLMIIFPFFRYGYNLFAGDYYKTILSFAFPFTLIYLGMKALSNFDKEKKLNLYVLGGTVGTLLLALNWNYEFTSGEQVIGAERFIEGSVKKAVTWFIVLQAGCIFLMSKPKFKIHGQILMLLFLCAELGYSSAITTNERQTITAIEMEQRVGYNDYTLDAMAAIKERDKSFFRINKDYSSGPAIHGSMNDGLIQDFYGTPSYRSLNQGYYIKFLQTMGIATKDNENSTRWAVGLVRPLLKNFGSIKYHISNKEQQDGYINASHTLMGDFHGIKVYRNRFYLPLGYTYDQYHKVTPFEELDVTPRDISLLKAVVISDEDDFSNLAGMMPFQSDSIPKNYTFIDLENDINARKMDTLNITYHSQKVIEGDITLTNDKFLFFSIPFDAGWAALVDGKEVNLKIANIGFMGLELKPGTHTVRLEYTMPHWGIITKVSFLALLVYLGWIVLDIRSKKTRFDEEIEETVSESIEGESIKEA